MSSEDDKSEGRDDVDDEFMFVLTCLSRPRVLYSSIYAWVGVTGKLLCD